MSFVLDRAGGAEVLKVIVADEIAALGQQLAAAAGDGARVETYVTDRAAAAVSVPAESQAKDGALTRAAAAVGLEVRPKPERKRKPKPARRSRSRSRKPSGKDASGDAAGDS